MKLASLEILTEISPHPNADRLEKATVLGWQLLVERGKFQQGEKILFIPIDTLLPVADWSAPFQPPNSPTCDHKPLRLKMVKLRGEHSAGLALSLNSFPHLAPLPLGTDVGEALGIQKYVKELPAHLAGDSLGDFPSHLAPKTDEINALSDLDLVKSVLAHPLTLTLKCDGSSTTLIYQNGELTDVCSRNLNKKDSSESSFWNAARKIGPLPKDFCGFLQAELCGPGIQKNNLKLSEISLLVFQIYQKQPDGSNGQYLTYPQMLALGEQARFSCVPLVPNQPLGLSLCHIEQPAALAYLQEIADNALYPRAGVKAEGIVVRPSHYPRAPHSRLPLSFKILSRNYKEN